MVFFAKWRRSDVVGKLSHSEDAGRAKRGAEKHGRRSAGIGGFLLLIVGVIGAVLAYHAFNDELGSNDTQVLSVEQSTVQGGN